MNKNTRKILALSVMVMFVFMFAAPFVMAAEGDSTPSGERVGLVSFGEMLQNKLGIAGAGDAGYPTILAFLLLVFIVALLVYDIADMLPFLSKPWMKTSFAIAFAVLAFMFFDMTQIKYLTTTYQAAGIAIVAIIPFIVIAAFVWKLDRKAQDETKPSYQMFGTAIWFGFGVYLLMKLSEIGVKDTQNPIFLAYSALTLMALAAVFGHSKIYGKFAKKAGKLRRNKDIKLIIRNLRNRNMELSKSTENPENMTKQELKVLMDERKDNMDQIKRLESEI